MNSIVHKITNNLKNENVDNTAINDIIQQVKEYWQYFGTIDWDEIDYIGILKAINCAKFLKAKFNDESKYLIMRKALVYQNDGVCVFKPTSFEESSIIGEPICCFAYSQGRWDEHYIGNGEAIYYVFDAMRDNAQDFVAITVHPNGKALILDKNHNWWTPSDSIKYIQSLGNGASLITTKAGKQINNEEIKENRNMNKKQVIKINENQLKQIVTESVKKVIEEGEKVNNKPYFYKDISPYYGDSAYSPGETIRKGYGDSYSAYDDREYVSSPGGGERVRHKDIKGIEKHNERAQKAETKVEVRRSLFNAGLSKEVIEKVVNTLFTKHFNITYIP